MHALYARGPMHVMLWPSRGLEAAPSRWPPPVVAAADDDVLLPLAAAGEDGVLEGHKEVDLPTQGRLLEADKRGPAVRAAATRKVYHQPETCRRRGGRRAIGIKWVAGKRE